MSDLSRDSTVRVWLASLELFGIKLGLETMRRVAEALGSPEHAYPILHIGGTNGKGSVAAFADAAIRAAGYRSGRYTSPHLVHLEERVHVDGVPVDAARLDAALRRVRRTIDELRRSGVIDAHPTFFEVTTAAAFDVFREAEIQAGVIEVGLGGRFDATNIVQPAAVAITSVSRDHEQHLGSTLDRIAFEKAGIVKPGVPVVAGPLPAEAAAVVARVCAELEAPLVSAREGCHIATAREAGRARLTLETPVRRYGPLVLALRGDHQIDNAIVAVRLLETASDRGLPLSGDAVSAGLTGAVWPGRLDLRVLEDGRAVLIDGAHNAGGAAALAAYIRSEWPEGLPLVLGVMKDKDLAAIIGALDPVARPLVLTRAPGRRAADLELLASAARSRGRADALVEPIPEEAMAQAWRYGRTIAVAGSLYLVGRVIAGLDRER